MRLPTGNGECWALPARPVLKLFSEASQLFLFTCVQEAVSSNLLPESADLVAEQVVTGKALQVHTAAAPSQHSSEGSEMCALQALGSAPAAVLSWRTEPHNASTAIHLLNIPSPKTNPDLLHYISIAWSKDSLVKDRSGLWRSYLAAETQEPRTKLSHVQYLSLSLSRCADSVVCCGVRALEHF